MKKIKNYYEILSINKDATRDEIKRAFRNLAKEWHPDAKKHDCEEATKKFAEISTAYEILSDTEKRTRYDFYRDNIYGYSTFQKNGKPYNRDYSYETEWEDLSRWFQDIYEKNLNRVQQHVNIWFRRIRRGFIGAAIGLSIGIVFRGVAIPLMILGWIFGYYLIRDGK
ncbi:J domain-containing protein [candidate division WOR-3 bacterium]|nr:J domain-containing protein [candidate division WOR-3 bacterium]